MIITKVKNDEELKAAIEPFNKLAIVGCGTCATLCQTGGEDQVKAMVQKLTDMGKQVTASIVIESPCDMRIDKRDLKRIGDQVSDADALLVMSCGVGVQVVGDATDKIALAALDTMFIGEVERIGKFYEMCRACGSCILNETGGVCPITRCAKHLLNGPCGGMREGKCEVGTDKDCAWVLIYNKLKEQGRGELFVKFREPRDYSVKAGPIEVIWK
ncbi:MAG: methylenetetrahydrofolate reductase C-terminal domain-containing protein [Candidatus Freyarchaeum deiterrae]